MNKRLLRAPLPTLSSGSDMPAGEMLRALIPHAPSAGMLPARVWPDNHFNISHAGEPFVLLPEDFYVTLATGATASTQINTPASWDHYIVTSSGFCEDADDDIPGILYSADVKLELVSDNTRMMADNVFVPFFGLFGDGRLPKQWRMPLVLPASSTMLVTFRNSTSLTLNIHCQFWALRRLRG